jgi:hypothetical protein
MAFFYLYLDFDDFALSKLFRYAIFVVFESILVFVYLFGHLAVDIFYISFLIESA